MAELIVNMYFRRINRGSEIFGYGRKIQQLYFVVDGSFDLSD